MIEGEIRANLESAFRPIDEAKKWVPRLDMLSNDELEKLLVSQERNIRYVFIKYSSTSSLIPFFSPLDV